MRGYSQNFSRNSYDHFYDTVAHLERTRIILEYLLQLRHQILIVR